MCFNCIYSSLQTSPLDNLSSQPHHKPKKSNICSLYRYGCMAFMKAWSTYHGYTLKENWISFFQQISVANSLSNRVGVSFHAEIFSAGFYTHVLYILSYPCEIIYANAFYYNRLAYDFFKMSSVLFIPHNVSSSILPPINFKWVHF